MYSKRLVVLLFIGILITSSIQIIINDDSCSASVLPKFYVDDDYDSSTPGWQVDHFDSIQDAIDDASESDRILVYKGAYSENLRINLTGLNIFGEDNLNTIITGTAGIDTVIINNESVNISHLTIKVGSGTKLSNNSLIRLNADYAIITDNILTAGQNGIVTTSCHNHIIYDNTISSNSGDGIKINQSNYNNITWNTISSNDNGIFAYSSDGNTIENNTIQSGSENGIFMNHTCDSSNFNYNTITGNTKNGIYLNDLCSQNTFYNNTFRSNTLIGLRIENSSNNNISKNNMSSNTIYGILISGSSNSIWKNNITGNSQHGIFLFGDDLTAIKKNNISENTYDGIRAYNSTSNTIRDNKIYGNSQYGAFLDYFTVDNTIFNNYFHNNTYNAIDKSTNQNTWSSSDTGRNIVGGSTISGNYWDDYDEVSEGAIDSNSNGIADSAYTIYTSVTDSGPLLDVTDPSIGAPQVSPSAQTQGGTVAISVTITDNIAVRDVRLNIVDPNGVTSNFSIHGNKSGVTYSCSKTYSTIGDYTFHIAARDPRNWENSTSSSFYIHKGTPPSITDNSPTSGTPDILFTINATVTSGDTSPSDISVYVNWDHGSHNGNSSMTVSDGNYFEANLDLDASIDTLDYYIFAIDAWGNSVRTSSKSVTITDSELPKITIDRFGQSYSDLPGSYTFGATITDNVDVSNVYIEYWYNGGSHFTSDMDNTNGNYFEKVIIPEGSPSRVYCIIHANDTSDNDNDTQSPFAEIAGPYNGFITKDIQFNGTGSFDLDGNITSYSWNFGDGTTGTNETPQHAYSSKGTYDITLTITDNDGNTRTDSTYATIIEFIQKMTTNSTLTELNNLYDIELTDLFYSYDTDGDEIVDTFVDPNNVLTAVQPSSINISGNLSFLISVDDTKIPEFIWDATYDTITQVSYRLGTVGATIEEGDNIKVNISVNKTSGWIYIEVSDQYPDSTLLDVTTDEGSIPSDRRWQSNGIIFILDDPEKDYQLVYEKFEMLQHAVFTPVEDSTIDENNPIIYFEYNIPVTVIWADFYMVDNSDVGETATEYLDTTDYMLFEYDPFNNFEAGRYLFEVLVEDEYGNQMNDYIYYQYTPYGIVEEEISPSYTFFYWFAPIIGIVIACLAVIIILKKKGIQLNIDYIYLKNRRILPFIRPFVFGPISINIDESNVSKAEIFVDGALKQTLNTPPYNWRWDEKTNMLRHTLETKIYDTEGNSISSGEMPFYIFNPSGESQVTEEVSQKK